MNDDIGAPFEGTTVDRGREGVVDDEGYSVRVRDLGIAFDIEDDERGVRERFAEKRLRVGAENGVDLLVGQSSSAKSTSIPMRFIVTEKRL